MHAKRGKVAFRFAPDWLKENKQHVARDCWEQLHKSVVVCLLGRWRRRSRGAFWNGSRRRGWSRCVCGGKNSSSVQQVHGTQQLFFTLRSYNSRSDWLIGRVVFLREVNAVMKYHCILVKLFYNKAGNGCSWFTQPDANTQRACVNLTETCVKVKTFAYGSPLVYGKCWLTF